MPIDVGHISEVDAALSTWQQGDAVIGNVLSFVHVADLSKPLTEQTLEEAAGGFAAGDNLTSIGTKISGFVVVSQTCDLLKSCAKWPFAQVAALQQVKSQFAKEVQSALRPSFAAVPAIADQCLVANHDLIMTIEKSVLAGISPDAVIRGARTDAEAIGFAECLSRRFARFAFPNDFNTAMSSIQERFKEKHGRRNSEEGKIYRALREIRVIASPAWDAAAPKIEILFVRDEDGPISDKMDDALATLIGKFRPTGPFKDPTYRIVSLAAMSASTYVTSYHLDLDNLSSSSDVAQSASIESAKA
jgi:hypothetical protein